jgi:SAM-dependent methyltransferase
MSVIFPWSADQIQRALASCETDPVTPLIFKYFHDESRILEDGCGTGRYVKYLKNHGYNVLGLEISSETVSMIHRMWPELQVVVGDAANLPFRDASFDGVISLGTVEHFREGPAKPLREIFRVLKEGGVALITVPCLNLVRRFKRLLWWKELMAVPRAFLSVAMRQGPISRLRINRLRAPYKYAVSPPLGDFFEYHLTPVQFLRELREAGFEIIEHLPIGNVDGLLFELNPLQFVVKKNDHGHNQLTRFGQLLDRVFSKISFFHCHMQLAIVKKPL